MFLMCVVLLVTALPDIGSAGISQFHMVKWLPPVAAIL